MTVISFRPQRFLGPLLEGFDGRERIVVLDCMMRVILSAASPVETWRGEGPDLEVRAREFLFSRERQFVWRIGDGQVWNVFFGVVNHSAVLA